VDDPEGADDHSQALSVVAPPAWRYAQPQATQPYIFTLSGPTTAAHGSPVCEYLVTIGKGRYSSFGLPLSCSASP